MSIVLSHSAVRLLYRAPARPRYLPKFPEVSSPLKTGAPQADEVARARALLISYGIPASKLETLELLVSEPKERRRMPGIKCHVCRHELPAHALVRLDAGIFAVDPRFCALLAGQDLDYLELVEYYYELCGGYELPIEEGESYREVAPLTSCCELETFFRSMRGMHGVPQALRAVRYARDGSRSPMETASTMTLVLPRRDGGLGIHRVTMNHSIAITGTARRMTGRREFFADAYIASARLLIEYMGMRHEEEERQADDSERDNALDTMGYHVVRIWRWAFFDTMRYRRILAKIRAEVGLRATRFPADFDDRQEALRRFVLRHWL